MKHKFKKKSEAGWFVKIILFFTPKDFVITLWQTSYYPDDLKRIPQWFKDHEEVHGKQWDKYKIFFPILYWVPPTLLAYFRWKFEREAYLVDIKAGVHTVEEVVDTLWSDYLWTWPKCWMRKWFKKELANGNS